MRIRMANRKFRYIVGIFFATLLGEHLILYDLCHDRGHRHLSVIDSSMDLGIIPITF